MFQFAKFEKSKERRLATKLGYSFPIRYPWITDASFLLNARASIQCILFDLVLRYMEHQPHLNEKKKTTSNYIKNLYS
ncbi:hypothetical protein RGQ29_001077 [Quercus rubra]|uniref:Uncharacterized protein n=1 Tax=Quercus rubra TaxID=3512 RepID=A0AAN7G808_QUERU|nr:hypothetical protein RGQ29_001077 [Quercus rubra]